MPDGTIYELSVDMDIGGNQVMNVHHFEQTSADFGQDPRQECIDAYVADVQTAQLACQSDDLILLGYRCRALFPVETQSLSDVSPTPGTLVGESFPANIGALVAWYSVEASPVRVGRTFLPGINESDSVRGLITAGLRVLLIGFGNAIIAELTSGNSLTFQKVLYKAVDDTFLDIITGEVRQRLKGLRSRTQGVGN